MKKHHQMVIEAIHSPSDDFSYYESSNILSNLSKRLEMTNRSSIITEEAKGPTRRFGKKPSMQPMGEYEESKVPDQVSDRR